MLWASSQYDLVYKHLPKIEQKLAANRRESWSPSLRPLENADSFFMARPHQTKGLCTALVISPSSWLHFMRPLDQGHRPGPKVVIVEKRIDAYFRRLNAVGAGAGRDGSPPISPICIKPTLIPKRSARVREV